MLLLLFSCHTLVPGSSAPPATSPAEPVLRRLTAVQYERAIADLLGDELVFTEGLEPDAATEGLVAIGSGTNGLSAWGVEQYEASAFSLLGQALEPGRWEFFIPCTPVATVDAACAEATLAALSRRAWRRPPTETELATLVGLAGDAALTLGDFYEGLGYALAVVLQTPDFIYRVELGEQDPADPKKRRFTAYETATRLSFLLWDRPPDDALLDAAASGALLTDEGLAAESERLWADPRARDGIRAFFTDMLGLGALDSLSKDPTIYFHMSPELGASAREQTLREIEHLVFELDGDYRDLLVSRETFIDQKLAAIYGIPAAVPDDFGAVTLPDDGRRRGLLGQASVLALHAHPVSSSPTRRGKFVREVLLCQTVPSPPSDVNTSLPEASAEAPTRRAQVQQHLEDPACASCHLIMDPIGLGLENFDGLGSWRDTENGEVIDASGDLDGVVFADAWGLGEALREHPALGPCLVDTLLRYANGRSLAAEEGPLAEWLAQDFAANGRSVRHLVFSIILSDAFRQSGEVAP